LECNASHEVLTTRAAASEIADQRKALATTERGGRWLPVKAAIDSQKIVDATSTVANAKKAIVS
jgi:hypothetical protein